MAKSYTTKSFIDMDGLSAYHSELTTRVLDPIAATANEAKSGLEATAASLEAIGGKLESTTFNGSPIIGKNTVFTKTVNSDTPTTFTNGYFLKAGSNGKLTAQEIKAGSNITISNSGNTYTISASEAYKSAEAISVAKAAEASNSATTASNQASIATTKASEALQSATRAENASKNIGDLKQTAGDAAAAAQSSAKQAGLDASAASTSKTNAASYESAAKTSKTNAASYESATSTSAQKAKTSETNAAKYESNALASQDNLDKYEATALASKNKIVEYETAAEIAKTNAESASNAVTSKKDQVVAAIAAMETPAKQAVTNQKAASLQAISSAETNATSTINNAKNTAVNTTIPNAVNDAKKAVANAGQTGATDVTGVVNTIKGYKDAAEKAQKACANSQSACTTAATKLTQTKGSTSLPVWNNAGNFTAITSLDLGAGAITTTGKIKGGSVEGAVWNDLTDCIQVPEDTELEYGYCYCFDGEKYRKTDRYLGGQTMIMGVHSDTSGFAMGKKHAGKELNLAVAGFVLAYVDKEYVPGTPLTCSFDGKLTEISATKKRDFPERIVGSFWKKETAEEWGPEGEKIKVNGRSWVKVL